MKKVLGFDIDVVGASASFLCAVHCAMVPLIVTFGLLSGVSFLADPLYDVIFIGSSIFLAGISLVNGYRNHHRSLRPLAIASLGFTLIAFGHLYLQNILGDGMSVLGGFLVAMSHVLNYKECRTCKRCRS